jgi:predicted GNAT family N-acyltransferase
MNVHFSPRNSAAKPQSSARAGHSLSALDMSRLGRKLTVFTPTGRVIEQLMASARSELPGLADLRTVQRVATFNPDSIWAIARKDRFDAARPRAEAFCAFLFLNEKGMDALASNMLDRSNPPSELLAAQHEVPAAIYVWHLHARGIYAPGIALVFEKISTPKYQNIDIFTRPITEDGKKFTDAIGFQEQAYWRDDRVHHLHYFPRSEKSRARQNPRYDRATSYRENDNIGVSVVRTLEDFAKVMAVRTEVYVGEQSCPYAEEFDGNDFSGNHLLAHIGNEPIGCMRIRLFAGFAKFERVAVRSRYRASHAANNLIKAGIEFTRMKGYTCVYGQIQERLAPFWKRHGFRDFEGSKRFSFSDYDYVEMILELNEHPDAVRVGNDPLVIIRPEGLWHRPGILDASAKRSTDA